VSPAQTALYFREWGAVRAHFVARGIDPKQADAKRHELHRKALGVDKSSKDFTNADLDKVLSAFWAITKPADLNAQLRQQDQGEQRMSKLLGDARSLASRCVSKPGLEGVYLDGMARKVFETSQYHLLNEKQLGSLCGILRRRIAQLKAGPRARGKQAPGELSAAAVPNENPF
jgi:hypothetical protein